MNLFQAVDMREGNPVTQIVRFAIPMLLGNIAQQLYNTVDSIIVGRFPWLPDAEHRRSKPEP